MEAVIAPIDRKILRQELTPEKFVRYTNNGSNKLYVITAHDSPNVMHEIGRLREISFRAAGGGTGKSMDIDAFDTNENPYKQLIVWDPRAKEILGGYRYIYAGVVKEEELATSELFTFSDKFSDKYLPRTIELGRSFVQPNYQSTRLHSKGLYALDNLWDGLGALVLRYPEVNYFFGKVTMYVSYNTEARNLLLYFLRKHFADHDKLVRPIYPLETNIDEEQMQKVLVGVDYKEDYRILLRELRAMGENLPPLINSYMKLSPSMKVFGTAVNPGFGGVEETGILIKISDIYAEKIERYTAPVRRMAQKLRARWWVQR
ncbi:MAG: GNAT family N-acetyltransferase [Bacteroidales bacterium]|nr:GNAT family N-acetyltransferase [Bacteroidales bacterium]MCL2132830.1 GNAT family N-acetyltransferase [Bacteroidales bacterium]